MRLFAFAAGLAALTACGSTTTVAGECGPAECADVCASREAPAAGSATGAVAAAASGGGSLTAFEKTHFDPLLEDLRAGVRPWDDKSTGICKGSGKDCTEFVGTEVTDLPPGEYMMRAELRVPKNGAWKVRFDTECTVTKKTANGESSSTNTSSKEYDVNYLGEERGSRLSPLYKITSPNPYGAQSCKWTLTGLHPDGDQVYTGSWSVPGKE